MFRIRYVFLRNSVLTITSIVRIQTFDILTCTVSASATLLSGMLSIKGEKSNCEKYITCNTDNSPRESEGVFLPALVLVVCVSVCDHDN